MEVKRDLASSEISALIRNKAIELGYDLCGITHADPFDELAKEVVRRNELFPDHSWYAKGHINWLIEPLAYPERSLKGAKSLIVCARRYNKYVRPKDLDGRIGKTYIFDHRTPYAKSYKAPVDFKEFLKEIGINVKRAVDVPEGAIVSARRTAVRAGLGRFGKNNFLYTRFGSWVWIDLWLTDIKLRYDDEPKTRSLCPPDCTRCIDACPTKALSAPNTLDYSKCIAYLSYYPCIQIQPPEKGPLYSLPPENLRKQMGEWLYGCDVCQDVCPINRRWSEEEEFSGLSEVAPKITLENIFRMDESYFQTNLYPRFFYMGQDLMWVWKSNSIRAMANSGDPKYIEHIEAACSDPDKNLREMGTWALQSIKNNS
jgi:epoxyqueuosine reductase